MRRNDAIIASAQGREATVAFRCQMNALYGMAAWLVTGNALVCAGWLTLLIAFIFLDLGAARKLIKARDAARIDARIEFLGASFACFGVSAALGVFVALYGGKAGGLLAIFLVAGTMSNVAANLYQSRLYSLLMAAPSAAVAAALPFLPVLGAGAHPLAAAFGALFGLGAFLIFLGQAAANNHRSMRRFEAAIAEARDGRAEAESRRVEAEKANKAKSELLANMSHELRTPLNAVIGYSEILEDELEAIGAGGCTQDATRIKTAGLRLLHLIEDLLDLSKIDAGRMEITVERFDVDLLVRGLALEAQAGAGARGNIVEMAIADNLGFARTDADKLRMTLRNLLSNANKFTSDGRITVSATRESAAGKDHLVFTVEDTGAGIAREQLALLFEPFSQADSSIATRTNGTGLALSKTRRMMQLLGGDLAARSVLGQGSTFIVRIPATLEARDAEAEPPVALEDARTILVIEDDPTARDLARRAAARAGMRALCADNAADGLFRARRDNPALILLDIELPDRNGWDILSMLKQDAATRAIPVLVVSVVADGVRATKLGAEGHLVKPVGRGQLAAAIRRHAAPPEAEAA